MLEESVMRAFERGEYGECCIFKCFTKAGVTRRGEGKIGLSGRGERGSEWASLNQLSGS